MKYSKALNAALAACFFSIAFIHHSAASAPDAAVITVESDTLDGQVRLGGTVVPEQIVNLSAQMPGDVRYIAGSEGDFFRAGEVLVELDRQALLAKREQVVSQISNAEANYRNAVVQYNHELVNPNSQANSMMGGAPSLFDTFSDPIRSFTGQGNPAIERRSNLYSYSVQVETAQNAIYQAYAALREIDESLLNAVSYAPFDGVILKKMVEQGDIVQPGMPLISFADTARLQIHVSVPTRLLGTIKSGVQINASLDGLTTPVPVRINRIFPMADAGGHTTMVKFDLPLGVDAHSGMYAEIAVPDPTSRFSALPTIPQSSIVWQGSLAGVFLVADDGSARLRLIRIGDGQLGDKVSVISGIKAGDRILANPSDRNSH
jgi:multidrug efflux pump subunit AcrA (membrane-fusion protein)